MIVIYKDGGTYSCNTIEVFDGCLYMDGYRYVPLDEVLRIEDDYMYEGEY
jgi:hypothetical protein